MKKLTIILFVSLSTSYCLAQQSLLQGQILTRYTSEKSNNMNFDTVKFTGTRILLVNQKTKDTLKTQTFADGRFYVENISKGHYTLFVDDPVLKSKRPIYISVMGSRTNKLRPIVVDRTENVLRVMKK